MDRTSSHPPLPAPSPHRPDRRHSLRRLRSHPGGSAHPVVRPAHDAVRAQALRPEVERDLRATVRDCSPQELFICMGKAYREALPDFATLLPANLPVHLAAGTMGARLAALHDWLYGEPPPLAHGSTANGGRAINIRGVAIAVSAEQALRIARHSLATGSGDPGAFTRGMWLWMIAGSHRNGWSAG